MGAGGGWTGQGKWGTLAGTDRWALASGQFKNLVSVGNSSFSPPSSACHLTSGLEGESVSRSVVSNSVTP